MHSNGDLNSTGQDLQYSFTRKILISLFRSRGPATLFLLCVFFFVSGCVAIPGKGVPVRTYADLVQDFDKKACVKVFSNRRDWHRDIMGSTVDLLEKSGYFMTDPEQCQDLNEEQNSITLNFKSGVPKSGDFAIGLASILVTTYSLTLLPGRYTESYTLNVMLQKKGQLVKGYKYELALDSWVHISLLLKMFENKNPPIGDAYEQMLMNFLYDYSRDVQKTDFFAADQKI